MSIISEIGLLLLVAACLFAWLKGGAAERAGAGLIGAAWVGSMAVQALTPPSVHEICLLVFDFVLAFGLLGIAIRYASLWLGAAMLLQAVILALHSEAMAGWSMNMREYVTALDVCSIAMLLPIVAATAGHWNTQRQARRVAQADHTPAPPAMPSAA